MAFKINCRQLQQRGKLIASFPKLCSLILVIICGKKNDNHFAGFICYVNICLWNRKDEDQYCLNCFIHQQNNLKRHNFGFFAKTADRTSKELTLNFIAEGLWFDSCRQLWKKE
jgi:hypothetical protein